MCFPFGACLVDVEISWWYMTEFAMNMNAWLSWSVIDCVLCRRRILKHRTACPDFQSCDTIGSRHAVLGRDGLVNDQAYPSESEQPYRRMNGMEAPFLQVHTLDSGCTHLWHKISIQSIFYFGPNAWKTLESSISVCLSPATRERLRIFLRRWVRWWKCTDVHENDLAVL